MATVTERRTVVIPFRNTRVVRLRVPRPPYRLELSVTGTFRPEDFGSEDKRQLGVNVEFKDVERAAS
jgi:hypothetical protein